MAYYKNVVVEWHDEPGKQINTMVSIDQLWNSIEDEDDGRIFYYFANEKEYEEAKDEFNREYEFWIVKER